MSCTTSQQMGLSSRSGSVLMEFVIVLPIYICLWGMLFLIGDMGLKNAALAVGDRVAAMDAGDRGDFLYGLFGSWQVKEQGLKSPSWNTYRAKEDFKGAWSWQTAGQAAFAYRLQAWGGGFLTYPYRIYLGEDGSSDWLLGSLVKGKTVDLRSKDRGAVRAYNYYTLRRTELARGDNAYRNWDEGRLTALAGGAGQYWHENVYGELFADSNPEKLDSSDQGADEAPDLPSGRKIYTRYSKFVDWSD